MRNCREQGTTLLIREVWCWLALIIFAVTACGELSGGDGPVISAFTVEPATISPGETVVLRWQVENLGGGRLTLEATPARAGVRPTQLGDVTTQSSTAVVVNEATTFRLTASGSRGTAMREAAVSILDEGPEGEGPAISFFRASPTATTDGGAPVTLEWQIQDADTVTVDPPGTTVAESGTLQVNPFATTVYTLSAGNGNGTSRATVTVDVNSEDRLLFLIAGQSNASGAGLEQGGDFPTSETEQPEDGVLMLTADLDWVRASEPTHRNYNHSFLVRFGKEVRSSSGMDVFLVPAADGGTALSQWKPGTDNFEEAVARTKYAAEDLGIPVSAVVWYQGESDTKSESRREDFVDATNEVLDGFRAELGKPDVIFVQLSKRLWSEELHEDGDNIQGHNLAYQEIRERQRLMEAGARQAEVGNSGESGVDEPYYHMVVAHDLPMSDAKHLSAEGQRALGSRIAHAFLQRGRGKGPRLESVTLSADRTTIFVDTTMTINGNRNDYDGYFSVFEDGEPRSYSNIDRDSDTTRIRIDFMAPLDGEIEVRYMPPDSTPLYSWSRNVVKAQVNGLELPLPAFGLPVEAPPEGSIPGLRMSQE